MNSKTETIFLILLTLVNFALSADRMLFEHLFIEDGLSQSSIFDIYQDKQGFLWFATQDGLNRYDGYSFLVMRHDPRDSNSISDNYVQVIREDDFGYLWMGTVGGGLNQYDPRTGRFKRYVHRPEDSTSVSSNNVTSILVEEDGILWIGTLNGGLNKFNSRTGKFTRYRCPVNSNSRGRINNIYSIIRDSYHHMWVGTGEGLCEADEQRNILLNRDSLILNPSHCKITSILEDRNKILWVAIDFMGLLKYSLAQKSVKYYKHHPFNPNDRFTIRILSELDSTQLLLGTFEDGLFIMDTRKEIFNRFSHDEHEDHSLSDNHVMSILLDGSGILWIGTLQGINKYDLKPVKFEYIKIETKNLKSQSLIKQSGIHFVLSVLEDHQGNIWYGSYGAGLFRMDRSGQQFVNFVDRLDDTPGIKGNDVWSLYQDSENVVWIGTAYGLHAYEPQTGRFKFYQIQKSASAYAFPFALRDMVEDDKGNLWVGFDGLGLYYFNQRTGQFTSHAKSQDPGTSAILNSCLALLMDRNGIIWIGTNGAGLYRFDPVSQVYSQYKYQSGAQNGLCSYRINAIYEDSSGRLWLGTSNGLNILNTIDQSFVSLTEKNGLVNSFIYGIQGDKSGNIWVTSNKGLSRISTDDQNGFIFRNYDVDDGLQSNEFNTNCSFQSSDGEIFFGGINGITSFYPPQVTDNQYIPNITITSLKIGDKTEYGNPCRSSLILDHTQKSFRFEFAAMDFTNPSKNQFEYMLEGFDKKWVHAAMDHQANYTNINPGHYILRVRGSNNDGIWNEEGTWINITIIPPIWESGIAYVLYLLLLVILLYSVIWWRSVKLERAKHRLEMIVAQKTQELQRSYEQLKRSQMELIRSAKLKAMGKIASGMAHDFNNILAIILGSAQILRLKIHTNQDLKLVHNIETAALDGSQIIKKIQDFSRNNTETKLTLIDLNQVLLDVIEVTRFQWLTEKQMQDIKIDFATEFEDIPLIRSNVSDLRLVFTNIIINSIEAFEKSGKTFIHTRYSPAAGFTIQIRDEGKGMDKETLAHIFDPFFSTKGIEGNGLGLSQVYGVVNRLNGQVSVESETGKGTTMTINLPDSLRADPDADETKKEPETLKVKKGKRLFIVEDESIIRDLYKDMLGSQGYMVFMVESGEEGLRQWNNESFDLIICDLGLPGMNGWEFIKKIREQNSTIPIIALTGWGDMISSQEAADHKIQKVISKPVQLSQFMQDIYNLL